MTSANLDWQKHHFVVKKICREKHSIILISRCKEEIPRSTVKAQTPYIILRDGVLTHSTITEELNMLFSKLSESSKDTIILVLNVN